MRDDTELNDHDRLANHVAKLVDACEQYSEEQKPIRDRALEYYNGEMNDLAAEEGRSASVSKDVRSVIKKLMPSIMRTLLSNDKIVDYEPVGPEDEEGSEQATDYVNHVVVPECGAEQAIHDAVFDALLVKTGMLKWTAYKRKQSKVYEFTNQPSTSLLGLEGEDGIAILDRVDRPENDQAILEQDPEAHRHDFKLRRIEEQIDIRLEAIPRGSFLIYPGAVGIEDSPIVGERQIVTRSELVSRGYDRDDVASIAAHEGSDDAFEDGIARQGHDWTDIKASTSKAMQDVLIYEVYVRLDQDGDGIAELYKICFAQAGVDEEGKHLILAMEAVDEAPYAEVVAEREAHQFEGHSIAEDVMDIQRIKTALQRALLDNIYWQNNQQPAIDPSKLTESGLEAVYNPAFGKPITLKNGANMQDAVQWNQVPFIAANIYPMMEYLDNVVRDRTGITDQSGGLDPEAFQGMTATSVQLMSESGIAQAEMIIRSLARGGIRKAFKGLLKLVIAHADQPRTVRLRGEWVEYDPRHWNVDMDCTVNVGLGAGSKERDLAVLQLILGLQKELLASIGPDNPFVKPNQLYNVLEKITETAGFPSADPYFTQPNPQEIAAKMQEGQGPSEAEKKVQMQMQLEQLKAQAKTQIEQAQMQADIQVKQAELEKDTQLQILKADQAREIAVMQGELDLLKHREKMQVERAKAGLGTAPLDPFTAGELYNGSA
jgi:hypothetical protein